MNKFFTKLNERFIQSEINSYDTTQQTPTQTKGAKVVFNNGITIKMFLQIIIAYMVFDWILSLFLKVLSGCGGLMCYQLYNLPLLNKIQEIILHIL